MNRRQKRGKESQRKRQTRTPQALTADRQAAKSIDQGEAKSDPSDSLVLGEVLLILLVAFLGVVPLGLVLATNTESFNVYILSAEKRAGVFSYASFWFSATAALAAGRGVLRTKGAGASLFKDSDYYWEGAIFIFAAAVCAALSVSDHPSTPQLSFWIFLSLVFAQVFVSALALFRLRGRTAKWGRAVVLRALNLSVLLLLLGGYGYLVFSVDA